jgi:hypothetical protein
MVLFNILADRQKSEPSRWSYKIYIGKYGRLRDPLRKARDISRLDLEFQSKNVPRAISFCRYESILNWKIELRTFQDLQIEYLNENL